MNKILKLPLEKILEKSFEAEDQGRIDDSKKILNLFDIKKNHLLLKTKKESSKGNIAFVEKTIKSIENARSKINYRYNSQINQPQSNKNLINKENLNSIAISFFNKGEFNQALKILIDSIARFPNDHDLNNNLSVVLKELKMFNEAEFYAKKAIGINPNSYLALTNLGNILHLKKNYVQAINSLQVAIKLNPKRPEAFANLSICYYDNLEFIKAHNYLEMAISLEPNNPKYLDLNGLIYKSLGNIKKAIYFIEKAIKIDPSNEISYNNLGNIYKDNFPALAIENYYKAIKLNPSFSQSHGNLSSLFRQNNNIKLSLIHIKKAITIEPKNDIFLRNLGTIYLDLGKRKRGIAALKKAIKLNPMNTQAHRILSITKKYENNDNHLTSMIKLTNDQSINSFHIKNLGFAIGKALEDTKHYSESFKYYSMANDICFSEQGYSLKKERDFFNPLKKNIRSEIQTKSSFNPIFILGMPRSGTSLIEQILTCNSQVQGFGELEIINNFVSKNLVTYSNGKEEIKVFTSKDAFNLKNYYTNEINQNNVTKKFTIDKLPHNFRWINLINYSFPNSKIIHVTRTPLDTCFSIYKNYFVDQDYHGYSFNQEYIGEYYKLYLDLMNFWNTIYPTKIYNCSYENLVENPEKEIVNLSKWCDLDFEKSMLYPEKNKNSVSTASKIQIRSHINTSSIGQWKNYRQFLKPLIKSLEE